MTEKRSAEIKVLGVGGGGCNALDHMFTKANIEGVDYAVCNTDIQSLLNNSVPKKIQLGKKVSKGQGAGGEHTEGEKAALESGEEIKYYLQEGEGTDMVIISCGMGGGTGTGAAPVIAQIAKEEGILTVGIVMLPMFSEGEERIQKALAGLEEMKSHVDATLAISNEQLRSLYGELSYQDCLSKADEVLAMAVKGIAEIVTRPGRINMDFADIRSRIKDSGIFFMGMGFSESKEGIMSAAKKALESPLVIDNNIMGAKKALVRIVTGENTKVTMSEINQVLCYVQDITCMGNHTDIIHGDSIDPSLEDEDKVAVIILATDFYAREDRPPEWSHELCKIQMDGTIIGDNSLPLERPTMEEGIDSDFANQRGKYYYFSPNPIFKKIDYSKLTNDTLREIELELACSSPNFSSLSEKEETA